MSGAGHVIVPLDLLNYAPENQSLLSRLFGR